MVGLIFFCFFLRSRISAQEIQNALEKQTATQTRPDSLDINGSSFKNYVEIDRLVVDETISKAGHEFVELFLILWNWPQNLKESFLMVIAERPFRGTSTQIVITVNDLVVFESFLQTRYDFLEYLAELANEQTSGYLINYENIMRQLEGDDLSGNGIY